MKNEMPLVTVVTACFNTAPYLQATLRSIQAQTLSDMEVILVDDCSTDTTLAIMREFATQDQRFKVIALQRNQGVVAARNAAMAQARGRYIAMLDGDDLWKPDALAMRVALAERYPTASVIATDFAWFNDELPKLPIGKVGLGPGARKAFTDSFRSNEATLLDEPFDRVASIHFAWTGATLVRRSAMTAIGNFDPTFTGPEDTLLWLRLAQQGAFVFSPQITAFYRQRAGSLVALLNVKGPKELQYLKVLEWIRKKPEFSPHSAVIRRLTAECHHISAQHYRRSGESSSARKQALGALQNQPLEWRYWRGLAAACLERGRSPEH
jgi:GT2 family glycosyltransferase